ncbi:uncharacterized protein [Apostichopus japonicus]
MIDNIQGNPLDNNPPESRHQPPNYMSPATRPPGPPMAPDKGMPTSPGYPQPSMNYLRPEDQYRPSHQPSAVEPNNYFLSSQHSRYMPGYTVGSSRMSPGTANPMSVGGPNQPFNHPDSRLCPPSSPYVQQQSQESHAPPSTDISREERQKFLDFVVFNTTLHMDYDVIKKATNNFDEKNKLGEGSFGKVYLADINQTKYAVKVLLQNDKLQVAFHNNHRSDQSKELSALAQFKHKNIVLMSFFSVDGENPCIIYEYLENGSLEDNLLGKGGRKPLSWQKRHSIAEGAALGINHLHKASKTAPLIHGDIKSANILLDKYFEPKIADFGLARPGPTDGRSHTFLRTQFAHGTLPYLPEEFKRNLQLSIKVDSFSFGVVLMEILTGERAYDERREPHQLLSSYVTEVTKNKMMSIQQLKDKQCPDWPDRPFGQVLNLAERLVGKYRQRPDMDEVLSCLKAIFSGEEVGNENEANAAQNGDSLSSLESSDLGKKQDEAASLPPSEQAVMGKVEQRDLPKDSALTEDELQRQKSIEDFHRKLELMSLGVKNEQCNPPGHRPTMGTENDTPYGGEHPPDLSEPSFRGGHMLGPSQPGLREDRPRWDDSGRHMPEMYQSQLSPQSGFKQNGCYDAGKLPPGGARDAPFSNVYQDNSSTSGSSNNPYSYTHRYLGGKETATDRAFYEGYRLGFQKGFQEAVLQQMQLRAMQQGREDAGRLFQPPDQMFPSTQAGHESYPGHPRSSPAGHPGPLSSLPQRVENVQRMGPVSPSMNHVPPAANLGYGAPAHDMKQLVSVDRQTNRANSPLTNNKTDDAKITTSGELSETNSHEKSVAALRTKPISLDEFRFQKEPQQSTEPM